MPVRDSIEFLGFVMGLCDIVVCFVLVHLSSLSQILIFL